MARKKSAKKSRKTKSKKRKSASGKGGIKSIPPWIRSLFLLLLLCVAMLGLGFGVKRYAENNAPLTFDIFKINIEGLPPWLDDKSRQELLTPAVAGIPGTVDAMDRTLLEKLEAYYAKDDWIHEVKGIEFIFPGVDTLGGIEAHLVLNDPLCAVQTMGAQSFYWVDRDGRRLGYQRPEPPPVALRMPVVFGAYKVPARPGESDWQEKLLHGFHLSRLFRAEGIQSDHPHWIKQIDIRNVGDRRACEVVLVTDSGTVIQWGRTDLAAKQNRPPVTPKEEKLRRLRKVLSGEIMLPAGTEVDLNKPV